MINNKEKISWLPKKLNNGWIYIDHPGKNFHSTNTLKYLCNKYQHSSEKEWNNRIRRGEIKINDKRIWADQILCLNDTLSWEREPWEEDSVPSNFKIIYDDGDLFVIDKPSGIPVTPGGGFLNHTITNLLKSKSKENGNLDYPIPIHRLGRFTSGVLLCARRKETRASISEHLRYHYSSSKCLQRIYRGIAKANPSLETNQSIEITTPIYKQKNEKLRYIWNSKKKLNQGQYNSPEKVLSAFTKVKLLEKRKKEDLLEIYISSGRPHQIRIHLASIGTPLIGDKLYKENGNLSELSRPGEGGYILHCHKIENIIIKNKLLSFEAPLPYQLKILTQN